VVQVWVGGSGSHGGHLDMEPWCIRNYRNTESEVEDIRRERKKTKRAESLEEWRLST